MKKKYWQKTPTGGHLAPPPLGSPKVNKNYNTNE